MTHSSTNRLPDPERTLVQPEKVKDYLLSPVHPTGRHKAAFFRSLGYTGDDWQTLQQDLQALATEPVTAIKRTEYGAKHEIKATITGPNGRSAAIVTIWMVRTGEHQARLITAYPED